MAVQGVSASGAVLQRANAFNFPYAVKRDLMSGHMESVWLYHLLLKAEPTAQDSTVVTGMKTAWEPTPKIWPWS
jgi:hypothetical protein